MQNDSKMSRVNRDAHPERRKYVVRLALFQGMQSYINSLSTRPTAVSTPWPAGDVRPRTAAFSSIGVQVDRPAGGRVYSDSIGRAVPAKHHAKPY